MARKRKVKARGAMKSVRYHGSPANRKQWVASGYSRNRKRRGKLHGAALAAHLKKIGKRKRTRTTRRAGVRVVRHGGGMAKRKRRRVVKSNPRRRHVAVARRRHRRNPVRRIRHRRHYRRNPSFVKEFMNLGTRGIKDAAGVVIGEAATNVVAGFIPFGANTGMVGVVKKIAVAIGVGYGAHRVLGADFARMVIAGGIAAPLKGVVAGLGIPLISPALSGVGYDAYPLAAYPPPQALGDGYGDGSTGGDYAWSEM